MNKDFKIPPKSANYLTTPNELVKRLECLIGTEFELTGKTRTDGSNNRKLVASILEKHLLPESGYSSLFFPNISSQIHFKVKG